MIVDSIIKNRKTQKVIAKEEWSVPFKNKELKGLVDELLELAASAPYHYRCHQIYMNNDELNSCLPYRFYIADASKCRLISQHIKKEGINAGKITNLLYAADLLFIVTWLPETLESNTSKTEINFFEGNIKNMEHIAAASSAIQNVLLGATSRNIPSYWSSGGQLRNKPLKSYLTIPENEIIMGTVFLFPKDVEQKDVKIIPGRLRNEGKEKNTWSKWLD